MSTVSSSTLSPVFASGISGHATTEAPRVAHPLGDMLEGICGQIKLQNGHLASFSAQDRTICIWDVENNDCLQEIRLGEGCGVALLPLPNGGFVSFDAQIVVVFSYDGEAYAVEGQFAHELVEQAHEFLFPHLLPDGRIITQSSATALEIRSTLNLKGTAPLLLTLNEGPVGKILLLRNGRLLTVDKGEMRVKIWDLLSGETCLDYEGHEADYYAVTECVELMGLASLCVDGIRV